MLKFRERFLKKPGQDESGASMVAAIFMLIVMFTMFGLAFDMMRNAYIRSTLQAAADNAAAAAAAQVKVLPSGRVVLRMENEVIDGVTYPSAKQVFYETYNVQRRQYKGMGCDFQGTDIDFPDACFSADLDFSTTGVLKVEVTDSVHNLWSRWWDSVENDQAEVEDDQNTVLDLQTSAVLRGVDEQRFGDTDEGSRQFTNPNG